MGVDGDRSGNGSIEKGNGLFTNYYCFSESYLLLYAYIHYDNYYINNYYCYNKKGDVVEVEEEEEGKIKF